MSPLFEANGLGYRYSNTDRSALEDLTIAIERGAFFTVIGPNGSGKSTLLRLMLGVIRPSLGTIRFDGKAAGAWDRRALARRVGVVAQLEDLLFPITVRELVAMGRYPHLGAWQREGSADEAAIAAALRRCDVAHLAERRLQNLSGGERQRARIARALAQSPDTLVLDEPTAALDLGHEMALFELLEELRTTMGVTIVAATHNLNLSARFASQLLLLRDGRSCADGPAAKVLTSPRVREVYGWPVRITEHPGPGPDTGSPQIVVLSARAHPWSNYPGEPQ